MKKFFITLICLIAAPFFVWNGLSDIITSQASKSWPTVQGFVNTSDVKETRGRQGQYYYAPIVVYRYEVDGTQHRGERIHFGDRSSSSAKKEQATAMKYDPGSAVTVHYRKSAPEDSVLEVGATTDNWIVLIIGIVLGTIGVFSALSMWKEFNSNNYAPTNGF